jgi:hypothetical protein
MEELASASADHLISRANGRRPDDRSWFASAPAVRRRKAAFAGWDSEDEMDSRREDSLGSVLLLQVESGHV